MVQPAEIQLSNRRFASDNLPENAGKKPWDYMGGCRSWLQRVMDAMVSLSSFLADPSLRWAYEVDYLETQVQGAFSLPLRSIWSLWVLTRNHFHPLFFIFFAMFIQFFALFFSAV
jgi:hypothetical protein